MDAEMSKRIRIATLEAEIKIIKEDGSNEISTLAYLARLETELRSFNRNTTKPKVVTTPRAKPSINNELSEPVYHCKELQMMVTIFEDKHMSRVGERGGDIPWKIFDSDPEVMKFMTAAGHEGQNTDPTKISTIAYQNTWASLGKKYVRVTNNLKHRLRDARFAQALLALSSFEYSADIVEVSEALGGPNSSLLMVPGNIFPQVIHKGPSLSNESGIDTDDSDIELVEFDFNVQQLQGFAEKYKNTVKELILRGTDFTTLSLLPADILTHGDRIMCDRTAAPRVLTNYGNAVNRRRLQSEGVDSTRLGLQARKSLMNTCIVRNLKSSLALKGQASSSSPLSAGQQARGHVPTTTIVAGSSGQPICITDSPVLDRKNGRSSVTFNLANQIKREDQNTKREGRTKMKAELATTTQMLLAQKNAHGRHGEMLNTARANTEAAFATPHFQKKVEEANKAQGGNRKFQDLRDHFSGCENNKRVAVNLLSKKMGNMKKANQKAAEAEKKQAAAESSDESEFQESGPDESEDENFKASKIIDVKGKGKSVQYLVEWEGFPKEDNTWEPAANILDKALIAEFKEMVASKKKGPKSRRVVKKRRRG